MNILSKLGHLLDGPSIENAARPVTQHVKAPVAESGVVTRGIPPARENVAGVELPEPQPQPEQVKAAPKPKYDHVPHPSLESQTRFRNAVRLKGFIVNVAIATKIQSLDQPWMRLSEAFNRYSERAAKDDYAAALSATAKAIASGTPNEAPTDTYSLSEWRDDYAIRRESMKREMRSIEGEARRLCQPVLEAYADALNKLADELEAPLREQAESFACAFYEPLWLLQMRKTAELSRNGALISFGRPATILGSLLPDFEQP